MAQLMPLPLTVPCSSKSRLVLPFWYWLTRIVLDNEPLNGCYYWTAWVYIFGLPCECDCVFWVGLVLSDGGFSNAVLLLYILWINGFQLKSPSAKMAISLSSHNSPCALLILILLRDPTYYILHLHNVHMAIICIHMICTVVSFAKGLEAILTLLDRFWLEVVLAGGFLTDNWIECTVWSLCIVLPILVLIESGEIHVLYDG